MSTTITEFVSQDSTKYILNRAQMPLQLTVKELELLKLKVSLMRDDAILNRESGNGVAMGIPIILSPNRLSEIRDLLKRIMKANPDIELTSHVRDRLVEDDLLPDGHRDKRYWADEEDVENCLLHVEKVVGVRLNVDHEHPYNTVKMKHLHPSIALEIQGPKSKGKGRLVTVVIDHRTITVITIL